MLTATKFYVTENQAVPRPGSLDQEALTSKGFLQTDKRLDENTGTKKSKGAIHPQIA